MRTKQTNKRKSVTSTAMHKKFKTTQPQPEQAPLPATPQPQTQPPKSPAAQPVELSKADYMSLQAYLDRSDKPFDVAVIPASRKRKRASGATESVQGDLFEDRLSVRYEVKPKQNWESLRRYKKFTGESAVVYAGDSYDGLIAARRSGKRMRRG
jgi:hypothetical protein